MRHKHGFGWAGAGLSVLLVAGAAHAAPLAESVVRIQPAKTAKDKAVPVMEKRPQAAPAAQGVDREPVVPLPELERQPAGEPSPLFESKGLRG